MELDDVWEKVNFMNTKKTILITGGAGFIGSEVIRQYINDTDFNVINIDKLTYAGNLESLEDVANSDRYVIEKIDICNISALHEIFSKYRPDVVMHLAAESHVDRSIDGPQAFIETNIIGTYNLLEVSRLYWNELDDVGKEKFRFHHVSTDEVYGDLDFNEADLFTEITSYSPSSPYSASKASSDHLVRAWNRTYGLPIIITNCSNNYGPYQFPEKLIPLVILNALEGKQLPVYGKGLQVRDWLHVEDHAYALRLVLEQGRVGETYNIGGHNEKKNIDVVKNVCKLLDEMLPESEFIPHESLIKYVSDRPGHDLRYAIDASKIEIELGWLPNETFETGLKKTVKWYLENRTWSDRVLDGSYKRERLGVSDK